MNIFGERGCHPLPGRDSMLIRIPRAQLKCERSDDGRPLALQQREPVGPARRLRHLKLTNL